LAVEWAPATAQKVAEKRDLKIILQNIGVMAAAAGSEWFYSIPFRNRREGTTTYVEGPTVQCAIAVAALYGNCNVDSRVQDLGDFWMIYARFIDYETGFSLVRPFQQRKSAAKIGGEDEGRKLEMSLAIGVSKAERNVAVHALQFYCNRAFEEAKNSLVERIGKKLESYRERTSEKLAAMVSIERVEAVIGRKVKDWLAPDIARVIALATSVSDGMALLDETFPPLGRTEAETTASTAATLDEFARQDGGAGQGDGSSDSRQTQINSETDESRRAATGAGDDAAKAPSPSSPAEIIQQLRERSATAEDDAQLQEVWDQMDIEGKLQGDKTSLTRAHKVISDRKLELRG
jgi:hypothetical protein